MKKFLSGKRLLVLISCLIIGLVIAVLSSVLFIPNTAVQGKEVFIYIEHNISPADWIQTSPDAALILSSESFLTASGLKRFKTIKAGRYRIKDGMTNQSLINMFRSGNQIPVRVRIDDVHDIYSLAGRLGQQLRADSTEFISCFISDSTAKKYDVNAYTLASIIVPDTYEFFWTISPSDFLQRMYKEHLKFWTAEKDSEASRIGLSRTEVATLASIVKAETAKKEEAPKIAGLYLNRLKTGMPLQSDPTAVFGNTARSERVYNNDLQNNSPYNTYRISGLPIGPIDFCEGLYLDAVLQAENHEYLYMCAQPGLTGYHNFSRTFDQHSVYAREYRQWLDKNGIR